MEKVAWDGSDQPEIGPISSDVMPGAAVWLTLEELQQLAAALPLPARTDVWRRTLKRSARQELGGNHSEAWDACLRGMIEHESAAMQALQEGPAEAVNPRIEGNAGVEAGIIPSTDAFAASVALLRCCEDWIASQKDSQRRQPLQQCLADQLVQVVASLHQWLVIEEAPGTQRGEWLWQAWELMQWRQALEPRLPEWWLAVREQLLRLGALAWMERCRTANPTSKEGQPAIPRALTLLQALAQMHDPLPSWIPKAQREITALGLAVQLENEPLSDECLQRALEILMLMKPQQPTIEPQGTLATGDECAMVLAKLQEALEQADFQEHAQRIKRRRKTIEDWTATQTQACSALLDGRWEQAKQSIQQWATRPEAQIPAGLDNDTWTELALNACSTLDERLPRWWLVESRSLPRSGHHYLKRVLQKVFGDQFSYCEGYYEPGCCQTSPCRVAAYWNFARAHKKNHLRLLKSHDFQLTDCTHEPMPGMIRLIQIRRPLHLLVSWLELEQLAENRELLKEASITVERVLLYHEPEVLEEAWRLIDSRGTVMSSEETDEWLNKQMHYIVGFLNKWLPLARPLMEEDRPTSGNFILRYEDLGQLGRFVHALQKTKDPTIQDDAESFQPRDGDLFERRSRLVTDLIKSKQKRLNDADSSIINNAEGMKELYSS